MMLERLALLKNARRDPVFAFLQSRERYYVRQIARELARDISGIKRELDNLDKAGLLTSEKSETFGTTRSTVVRHLRRNQIHHRQDRRRQGAIAGSLTALSGLRQAWLYSMNSHPPGEGRVPSGTHCWPCDLTDLRGGDAVGVKARARDQLHCVRRDGVSASRAEADPFLTEVFGGRNVLLIGRDDGV